MTYEPAPMTLAQAKYSAETAICARVRTVTQAAMSHSPARPGMGGRAVAHIMTVCHQVPSPTVVMRHLGLFYYWHMFNVIPTIGRIICR
jgi:predicted TIM-barrel fold metal-dependent hydrolase